MNRNYPKVSLAPLEIDRILSHLGNPSDEGSHLKKKLLAARKRHESAKAREKEKGDRRARPNL